MVLEFDFTAVSITIIAVIGMIFGSKTILNYQNQGSKYTKAKVKEQDEYVKYLKSQITIFKNKANNMERGPQIEGDINELDGILPNVVSEFADFAPKWLQPILKDNESQQWILKYVQEHPDVAKKWFSKIVGKKLGSNTEAVPTEGL